MWASQGAGQLLDAVRSLSGLCVGRVERASSVESRGVTQPKPPATVWQSLTGISQAVCRQAIPSESRYSIAPFLYARIPAERVTRAATRPASTAATATALPGRHQHASIVPSIVENIHYGAFCVPGSLHGVFPSFPDLRL